MEGHVLILTGVQGGEGGGGGKMERLGKEKKGAKSQQYHQTQKITIDFDTL